MVAPRNRRPAWKTSIPGVFLVSADTSDTCWNIVGRDNTLFSTDSIGLPYLPMKNILVTQLGSRKVNLMFYHPLLATVLAYESLGRIEKWPLVIQPNQGYTIEVDCNGRFDYMMSSVYDVTARNYIIINEEWIIEQFSYILNEVKCRIPTSTNTAAHNYMVGANIVGRYSFRAGNSYVSVRGAIGETAPMLKISSGFSPAYTIHGMADKMLYTPDVNFDMDSTLIDIITQSGTQVDSLLDLANIRSMITNVEVARVLDRVIRLDELGFSPMMSIQQLSRALFNCGLVQEQSRANIGLRSTFRDIGDIVSSL